MTTKTTENNVWFFNFQAKDDGDRKRRKWNCFDKTEHPKTPVCQADRVDFYSGCSLVLVGNGGYLRAEGSLRMVQELAHDGADLILIDVLKVTNERR